MTQFSSVSQVPSVSGSCKLLLDKALGLAHQPASDAKRKLRGSPHLITNKRFFLLFASVGAGAS